MLFITGIFVVIGVVAVTGISITVNDLPECAVECFWITGEKVNIPVTEYEQQSRSVPFQIALRGCFKKGMQ